MMVKTKQLSCYIHGEDCFVDWGEKARALKDLDWMDSSLWGDKAPFWLRHDIAEHVAIDELSDDFEEPVIGPLTAIARLHSLRIHGRFSEADKVRDEYNILVKDKGYISFWKKW